MEVTLVPRFIMGHGKWLRTLSAVGTSSSAPNTGCGGRVEEVVFATSLNYRFPVYVSPLNDPMAAGKDAFLQPWDGLQVYAFPPFPLIRQVLSKLRSSRGTLLTLVAPLWLQKEWFQELWSLVGGSSGCSSCESRSSQTAACSSSSPEPPCAATSCVGTVQRFARHIGLSRGVAGQLALSLLVSWPCVVAGQLALCRCWSVGLVSLLVSWPCVVAGQLASRRLYQHRWACYRRWCSEKGHSVSSPSISKIADFLLFLRMEKCLSAPTIRGYRWTLSAVFKFCLPDLQDHFVLRDLIRSFALERPLRPVSPLAWDRIKVLSFLCGPTFEPLLSRPLWIVTMKVLFLLSLATAKHVGEFQAVSFRVAFQGGDLSLSYLPEFVVKTESERNPLPRSFLVQSLSQFVGDLPEERLLCPVQTVCTYLTLMSSILPHPHSHFVSHPLSKNALSFFMRQVIIDADAFWEDAAPRAHSVCGMATSAAFLRNWSVSKVLEAATWRSNPVFASFYFRNLSFSLDGCSSLGPLWLLAPSLLNLFLYTF